MKKISLSRSTVQQVLQRIGEILQNARSLLVIMHNNPDPDALASALAVKMLVEERFAVPTTLCYGGMINRAENDKMVKELEIPVDRFENLNPKIFDRFAMVDTQPGRGNNPLPPDIYCHLVFDHHQSDGAVNTDLMIYNRKIGSTATLLCELLIAAGVGIKTSLATALIYAIRTETQELRREAHKRDVEAYLTLYPLCSLRKIGEIAYPRLPNSYFEMLSIALQKALIFRFIIFVPLGSVPLPGIVAETADFFLRRNRATWVLVMGQYGSGVFFSLRTTHAEGRAFRILQNILDDKINAGGHETYAGGRLNISSDQSIRDMEIKIAARYAAVLGYTKIQWKPLIKSSGASK
jgi:nanoRNase/pAp phosphatase (c-di-AMP/oligoRNAs hydrolase)